MLAKNFLLPFLMFLYPFMAKSQIFVINPMPKITLNLSPISLIDVFDGVSIRPGIDFKIKKKFYAYFEGGYYLGNILPIVKIKPRGFLVKPGIKYYFSYVKSKAKSKFLALEYMFKYSDYRISDSFKISGNIPFRKEYGMHRNISCVSIKYGETYLYSNICLEWFAGLGARFTNSVSDLTPLEEDSRLTGEVHGSTMTKNAIRETGKFTLLNIVCGGKICYILK